MKLIAVALIVATGAQKLDETTTSTAAPLGGDDPSRDVPEGATTTAEPATNFGPGSDSNSTDDATTVATTVASTDPVSAFRAENKSVTIVQVSAIVLGTTCAVGGSSTDLIASERGLFDVLTANGVAAADVLFVEATCTDMSADQLALVSGAAPANRRRRQTAALTGVVFAIEALLGLDAAASSSVVAGLRTTPFTATVAGTTLSFSVVQSATVAGADLAASLTDLVVDLVDNCAEFRSFDDSSSNSTNSSQAKVIDTVVTVPFGPGGKAGKGGKGKGKEGKGLGKEGKVAGMVGGKKGKRARRAKAPKAPKAPKTAPVAKAPKAAPVAKVGKVSPTQAATAAQGRATLLNSCLDAQAEALLKTGCPTCVFVSGVVVTGKGKKGKKGKGGKGSKVKTGKAPKAGKLSKFENIGGGSTTFGGFAALGVAGAVGVAVAAMRRRRTTGYALVDDNAFMVETAPIVKCSIDNDMTESTPMLHI